MIYYKHSLSSSLSVYIYKYIQGKCNMSGRRSSSSRISDDQIIELLSKLHQLLPEIRNSTRSRSNKASASKVLEETCNYIRSLEKQMDDLSARLSHLLSTIDADTPQAAIIRALI